MPRVPFRNAADVGWQLAGGTLVADPRHRNAAPNPRLLKTRG